MGLLSFLTTEQRKKEPCLSCEDAMERYLALKATTTQSSYRGILREFSSRQQHKRLSDYTERECLAWATWALNQKGVKGRDGTGEQVTKATVLRKAVIIRGWLALAHQQNNPMDAVVERLKGAETGEKRATEVLTSLQVRQLLESPSDKSLSGIRDRAFLACLFGGALRISEVLNLTLKNIQRDRTSAFVELERTKSGKRAEQVLPDWAAERIEAFAQLRRRDGASQEDLLFINKRGKALAQKDARRYFQRLLQNAGLPSANFTPHSARATAITQLLTSGIDYNTARTFARHSSFSMVARYDKRFRARDNAPGKMLKY